MRILEIWFRLLESLKVNNKLEVKNYHLKLYKN